MNLTNYKKLETKSKIVTNAIIFLAVIGLLSYFALLPKLDSLKRLKVEIINAKISINDNIEKEKNLGNLKNDLEKIEPQIDKLNKVFINKNQELEYITAMEKIAGENQIDQNLNLNTFPKENEEFSTISIDIVALGTFDNLMRYLMSLESSQYYININHISLQSGKSGARGNIAPGQSEIPQQLLSMNIKADTYFK